MVVKFSLFLYTSKAQADPGGQQGLILQKANKDSSDLAMLQQNRKFSGSVKKNVHSCNRCRYFLKYMLNGVK